MTPLALHLFIISISIYRSHGFSCNSDYDCELLGKCVKNTCECNPGWKGDSCSTLNLGPAPYPEYGVFPSENANELQLCYSWGFSVVHSNTDNLYHAYVNTGCFNATNPNQTSEVPGSDLLHLTSSSQKGPFKPSDITMPMTSFNPHIIYSNTIKKYLLFFRINELTPEPYCFGNESVYYSSQYNLTANTMDVAASDTPYGPWTVNILKIENMPNTHISNPSAIELSNGTFILSYRFNTNAEHVGIAVSTGDYKGPYYNIANLSVDAEDPYLWQSKIDGSFHLIFHAMSSAQHHSQWPSLHAYSMDLYNWTTSSSWDNYQIGAYSTNVTWSNGNISTYYRRERPEIGWSSDGITPLYFYSGVMEFPIASHSAYSFSVVQNILH